MSETWASESTKDLLGIPGYSHEQCIQSNKKKEGGASLYIQNSVQYERRDDLGFHKKTTFNANRNIIIGENLQSPPLQN